MIIHIHVILILLSIYLYCKIIISNYIINYSTKNTSLIYISSKYFDIYDKKYIKQWNKISICLFTSMHHASQGYISTVMNNYNMFWPSNIGKKVILLDKGFEYLETYITEKWNVYYEEYNLKGRIRQQYSFYIAYKYCSPNKYIAYMDSDSVFTMKVSKFMLFDDLNKPFFLYTNKIRMKNFNPLHILKFNQSKWGDGMISFPVLIYTEHLIHLNAYLHKIYKSTIESIINKYFASQFCVILEYIKKYYRYKYHFIIYENHPLLRCALHIPYAYGIKKSKDKLNEFNAYINKITYDGICSILNDIYPAKCSKFNISKFYNRFYTIDTFEQIKPTNCMIDIIKYNNLKKEILSIGF